MTDQATTPVVEPVSLRAGDAPFDDRPRRLWRRRSATTIGLAFAAYLGVSLVLWWHVWSAHPTTVTICGCDDPSLSAWFLEWPAYALAHGHNPFYSAALFHPTGINLVSNTGMLAIGIPLAPVTWLFGPVASLNVALSLGPPLSAVTMFWLLRRWVPWTPAAFVGGLVFGFSPFVFVNMAVAHLNLVALALLPLMVACLDELLVRQRRRPWVTGAALGLLVTVQFFVSSEVLAMVAVCAAAAVVVLVAYAALRHRAELAARAPHAGRGLAAAAAVTAVLLAYPVWFALEGPAHLSGLVWPDIAPGAGGISIDNLWHLRFLSKQAVNVFAGYQGPRLPQAEYLGLGMIIVLGCGVIAWRRDRRLWFFAALGVISVVLSLGRQSFWTPWRVLAHVPLVQNVVSGRFVAITSVCVSILLAIIVGRAHDWVKTWAWSLGASRRSRHRSARAWTGVLGAGVALAVAAVAVVPMGTALAGNVPLTAQPVSIPRWFAEVAPHLPPGQVILTFPPAVTGGSAMTWQAVDSLHFALATGAGPSSIPERAGKERAGLEVITAASSLFSKLAPATRTNVDAVRQAVAGWGVTLLVVPDPTAFVPRYDRTSSTAWALGFFTLAIGQKPQFRHDAWVWTEARPVATRLSISAQAFAGCTTEAVYKSPDRLAVPNCVLAASRPI
jgi:hypothetical protein